MVDSHPFLCYTVCVASNRPSSVTKYSSATGILHLEHAYPASTVKDNRSVTALVDVDLLIGNLKATNVQAGEWVNVIGYVQGDTSDGNKDGMQAGNKVVVEVKVQAMMLWSAGQVELREYEKSVRKRNEIHMLR